MNYKQQTGKTIHEAFLKFHKENPKVYNYFREYFFYLHKRKGWERVSGIIERLRWEILVKTNDPDFKINNNFTAHYVRLFLSENPEYEKCFELRNIKSDVQIDLSDLQTSLF